MRAVVGGRPANRLPATNRPALCRDRAGGEGRDRRQSVVREPPGGRRELSVGHREGNRGGAEQEDAAGEPGRGGSLLRRGRVGKRGVDVDGLEFPPEEVEAPHLTKE